MDIEKLLEVIQVQRHDFLNHLQVISGFLQLNKPERIREYIELAIVEMRAMSHTARFKIPEITAALLVGFNEASKYQAKMELMVNSSLDHCTVAGSVVGGVLESILNCYFKNLSSPELGERNFTVSFEEGEIKYNICLCSPASCIDDPVILKKDLDPLKELLHKHGGRLNTVLSENIEIFLDLPRKRAENGQTTR